MTKDDLWRSLMSAQVIVDDLSEAKAHVHDCVGGFQDLEHRQFREWCQRMRLERNRAWTGSGSFHHNIGDWILNEFTDPEASVDMRDNL